MSRCLGYLLFGNKDERHRRDCDQRVITSICDGTRVVKSGRCLIIKYSRTIENTNSLFLHYFWENASLKICSLIKIRVTTRVLTGKKNDSLPNWREWHKLTSHRRSRKCESVFDCSVCANVLHTSDWLRLITLSWTSPRVIITSLKWALMLLCTDGEFPQERHWGGMLLEYFVCFAFVEEEEHVLKMVTLMLKAPNTTTLYCNAH